MLFCFSLVVSFVSWPSDGSDIPSAIQGKMNNHKSLFAGKFAFIQSSSEESLEFGTRV
jgi:hypothetical protein